MTIKQLKNGDFNPRSREGSDQNRSNIFWDTVGFQSTLPRRERLPACRVLQTQTEFQSTLPRRERHFRCGCCLPLPIFQSTLPRRERHDYRGQLDDGTDFNPRSREGSDKESEVKKIRELHFNPRSREGSDACDKAMYLRAGDISIHAPAKGTTMIKMLADMFLRFQSTLPRRERHIRTPSVFLQVRFQSTLPRRERLDGIIDRTWKFKFQSTLPRRERHNHTKSTIHYQYFNPRSREGNDCIY